MKGSAHLLACTCICAGPLCSAQFSPLKSITTELVHHASSVVSGDTDNDGDPDIVVGGGAGLVLFENMDGQGTFGPIIVLDRSVNIASYASHVVDVDHDGHLDIVIESEDIVWCRNLGGNAFSPPVSFPNTGPNHWKINFDDTDGDGDQDAIMVMAPDHLVHSENLGGGQFSPATQLGIVDPDADLLLFDLDGDSDKDIAASYIEGADMQGKVFRNEGNGSYALTSTLTLPGCNGAGGRAVVAVDVDTDGNDDLIDRVYCAGQCQWRRSLGDGTFDPPVALPTFSDMPFDIHFADIDADGLKDLVVLTEAEIQAALNQGAGTFGPPERMGRFIYGSYFGLGCLADVNGDAEAELFAADYGYSRVRQFHLPGDGSLVFDQFLADYVPRDFEFTRIADLNGDAWPDVVRTYDNDGMVVAYANNGPQGFSLGRTIAETDTTLQADIDLIDMDDDGDRDLIVLADSLHLFTNEGDFQFEKTYSFYSTQFDYDSRLKCHDLDGDGDVDILVSTLGAIRRLRNDGANSFTLLNNISPLQFGADFAPLMDVDDDGDMDVLAYDDGDLVWVRNDGGLNFGVRTVIDFFYDAVDTTDIDMDGDLDIFRAGGGPTAQWLEKTGPATFAAVQDIALNGISSCLPRIMDVDGDGDPDVVLLVPDEGGSVVLNDGTGNFGAAQPLLGTDGMMFPYTEQTRIADMDMDGDMDIVHCVEDDANQPLMLAWRENFLADPYHLSGTVFADLDGDGALDVGEVGLSGASITATPTGYLALGNGTGEYLIYSNEGSQTVAASLASPLWSQSSSPVEYTVSPSEAQPDWTDLDFGFQPITDTSIIHPELTLAPAPCSATTSLWMTLMNEGTRIEHGTMNLALDEAFSFVGSEPPPSTVNGNLITWTFTDLTYFGTQVIHASVTMPDAQSIGDAYSHALTVITWDDQGDPTATFSTQLDGVVSCAFDPNDKLVSPQGYGAYGALTLDTEHLDYTIRFQNTGNAPAADVVLRDQLDAEVDIASLRVLGFSHQPTDVAVEPSGELVVRFIGIQLPDSGTSFTDSQGFIKFRLDLLPGLPHLAQAHNTAEIYFDLNELVQTNTTLTTLVDCALWEPTITALTGNVLEADFGDDYQWYLNGDALMGEVGQTLFVNTIGDYTATVISPYGCEATTPVHTVSTLGITDQRTVSLVLVPNPFTDEARLFLNTPLCSGQRLVIMDIHGRESHDVQGNGSDVVTIDRGGMATGVYLLLVKEESRIMGSIRMVVQ